MLAITEPAAYKEKVETDRDGVQRTAKRNTVTQYELTHLQIVSHSLLSITAKNNSINSAI